MSARIAGLLIKELIQFLRDRVLLLLILWLYTVEVIICAYALSFDVTNLPLAIVDRDQSPTSRRLIEQFLVGDAFAPAGRPASLAQADAWLQSGRARMVLGIPEGFEHDLRRQASPAVQLLLDGANSNTAAFARAYAIQLISRFEQEIRWPRTAGTTVRSAVRIWYNPEQTFTSYTVLSMIALAALLVGVIHSAASIVREKEIGTIEQLMVTPIGTGELFFAKVVPTLGIGVLSVFPSLLIVDWFGVPFRGSLVLFLALTAVFHFSAIALGVFVAAISRTLQQALLLSFFGLFPIMFLSGTVAPVESMPTVLQKISLLSPLRHYMEVILGIFLKGTGLTELWPQSLALIGIGTALFGTSLIFFRRTVP